MLDYHGTFSLTYHRQEKKRPHMENVKTLVHSCENFYHFTHTHKHIHIIQA